MKGNPYLISVTDCARQYNISRDRIYAVIRSGKTDLPYVKINNVIRINVPMFEKYLDEKSSKHEELF